MCAVSCRSQVRGSGGPRVSTRSRSCRSIAQTARGVGKGDPDPAVLEIARAKADAAGADIRWFEAMGDELDAIDALQQCDKIVSSLVLHQCSMEVKQAIAAQMFRLLKPGGTLFIADYGEQRSLLMRMLFRQIQLLDGFEYTEPNAKGCVPEILADAGFQAVEEVRIIPTPTGSISIYRARR
ncbi:MAG: class I SAM-dependent methyltransferase [Dechloromonas sp.]|nr:MAG: class I SAM-dependent methyltransferase [Dechloromonas sp.]